MHTMQQKKISIATMFMKFHPRIIKITPLINIASGLYGLYVQEY